MSEPPTMELTEALAVLAFHLPHVLNTEQPEPAGGATTVEEERWLSPAEVAERTSYGERYVWRLCRAGRIPGAVKPPGTKYWRIPEWGLAEFLSPSQRPRRSATATPTLPALELKPVESPKRKRF